MIELETTLHDFNPAHFGGIDDFRNPAKSNERDTLMLACPDHGTGPDNVSFAGSDRFFILQHLAASVPSPADSAIDNTFDSILCGFDGYDIRHVIVCGHLGCGVIPNWLKDTGTTDTGGLRARFHSNAVKAVSEAYPELSGAAYIERLIHEHALFQLENLQSHKFIRDKLDAGALKLHLWIVNDETTRILAFDPTRSALVPIEQKH
jgi:carbonic anhydrase